MEQEEKQPPQEARLLGGLPEELLITVATFLAARDVASLLRSCKLCASALRNAEHREQLVVGWLVHRHLRPSGAQGTSSSSSSGEREVSAVLQRFPCNSRSAALLMQRASAFELWRVDGGEQGAPSAAADELQQQQHEQQQQQGAHGGADAAAAGGRFVLRAARHEGVASFLSPRPVVHWLLGWAALNGRCDVAAWCLLIDTVRRRTARSAVARRARPPAFLAAAHAAARAHDRSSAARACTSAGGAPGAVPGHVPSPLAVHAAADGALLRSLPAANHRQAQPHAQRPGERGGRAGRPGGSAAREVAESFRSRARGSRKAMVTTPAVLSATPGRGSCSSGASARRDPPQALLSPPQPGDGWRKRSVRQPCVPAARRPAGVRRWTWPSPPCSSPAPAPSPSPPAPSSSASANSCSTTHAPTSKQPWRSWQRPVKRRRCGCCCCRGTPPPRRPPTDPQPTYAPCGALCRRRRMRCPRPRRPSPLGGRRQRRRRRLRRRVAGRRPAQAVGGRRREWAPQRRGRGSGRGGRRWRWGRLWRGPSRWRRRGGRRATRQSLGRRRRWPWWGPWWRWLAGLAWR